MVYTTRIPCKANKITFTDTLPILLDTHGLDCTLKAVGGDIIIKVFKDDSDEQVFILSENEKLDFSGRIYILGSVGTYAYTLMYTTF